MRFILGTPPKGGSPAIKCYPLGLDYADIHLKGSILGTLALMPIGYLWWSLFWPLKELNYGFSNGPLYFFSLMAITLISHELCHVIAFPGMGLGSSTCIGFDPKSAVPYASYLGIVSRNRFLLAVANPLIALTVAPFFFALIYPAFAKHLVWISVINLMGAAGDMFIFIKVLQKVPKTWFIQGESFGPLHIEKGKK